MQVLVSGSTNIINSFYQHINNNDIRVKKRSVSPTYHISELEENNGPNIDWNDYQLSFMSEQMYKGFHEANIRLTSIEDKLKPANKRMKSAKKRSSS